jgi:hypothetical protein
MTKQKSNTRVNKRGDQRGLCHDHLFEKGAERAELAGRKPGGRNKLTVICREAIASGFETLGGVEGLVAWAKADNNNLTAFYTRIWVKLLPIQIKLTEQNLDVVFHSYEAFSLLRRASVLPFLSWYRLRRLSAKRTIRNTCGPSQA